MANPLDVLGDHDMGFSAKPSKVPLIIVLLVLGIGAGVVFFLLPKGVVVEDCGDLSDDQVEQVRFRHDMFCALQGVVETDQLVSFGREDRQAKDPKTRFAGVRYFVRLEGAPVVAALPAADLRVRKHLARRGSLLGFEIDGTGRIFEPEKEKGYDAIGKAVAPRLGFAGRKWFVFDTQAELPQ